MSDKLLNKLAEDKYNLIEKIDDLKKQNAELNTKLDNAIEFGKLMVGKEEKKVEELETELKASRDKLQSIADIDYRGTREQGSIIAEKYLKEQKA